MIYAMLHLKGTSKEDVIRRALLEAKILVDVGFKGLIIENYFSDSSMVEHVLEKLRPLYPNTIIGINVLGNNTLAFFLAEKYLADLIQIDSVCGHLAKKEDVVFESWIEKKRKEMHRPTLLGGVRFKYQPVCSGRTEKEDVIIGARRCDAVVVTGEGTGLSTPIEKLRRFREYLGPFCPIIVGAGLDIDNVKESMEIADGGIIGSWIKEDHVDTGELSPEYAKRFMKEYLNG